MVNIKDLFQKGYKYHQSGDLAAAATFYLKILDKQPEHTDTILMVAPGIQACVCSGKRAPMTGVEYSSR